MSTWKGNFLEEVFKPEFYNKISSTLGRGPSHIIRSFNVKSWSNNLIGDATKAQVTHRIDSGDQYKGALELLDVLMIKMSQNKNKDLFMDAMSEIKLLEDIAHDIENRHNEYNETTESDPPSNQVVKPSPTARESIGTTLGILTLKLVLPLMLLYILVLPIFPPLAFNSSHLDLSTTVSPVYRKIQWLKENNKTMHTEPFYTSLSGYKFKMVVHTNGRGKFIGTHLSVVLVLMAGNYDQELSFPINGIGKISLVDPKNITNLTKLLQYDDSLPERGRQKVTQDGLKGGHGINDYISHQYIDEKNLVIDESLCFRIEFDSCEQKRPHWYPDPSLQKTVTEDSPPCHGTFPCVLTLVKYSEFKKTDTRWKSQPFYSSVKGYKLHLVVDANGSGEAKGNHLSIGVHHKEGEYDDQLVWPINVTVTVRLLNWIENKSHAMVDLPRHRVDNATDLSTSSVRYGRLIKKFISHSVLENKEEAEIQYIKEDTLCLEVLYVN